MTEGQKISIDSALKMGADVAIPFLPYDLDKRFVERNKNILNKKRGAGYWLWKPYVILKALLENADWGDLIIYIDAGVQIIRPLSIYTEQLLD